MLKPPTNTLTFVAHFWFGPGPGLPSVGLDDDVIETEVAFYFHMIS